MEVASVEVIRKRGTLIVQATGRTPRGQRYIKGELPLAAKTMKDPNFKRELATAMAQLLESEA